LTAAVLNAQEPERTYLLATRALVAAHRGEVALTRRVVEEGQALAQKTGSTPAGYELAAIAGFVEVSLGNASAALSHLEPLRASLLGGGFREPTVVALRYHHNAIEALVAAGRPDDAEELAAELEQLGRRLDRAWALAIAARGRGLVCSARGDAIGAAAAFEEAVRAHERLDEPFERARTLLAQGSLRRRANQRRAARAALDEALAEFERLGARIWAERAREELARIGGRAPSSSELTPSERRVAELVVQGRTNREVAAALFVAERTVETHLSHIYGKLGVRSRTELARRLAPR
jgi:DNA-binding CsgD family transcriptional regulator